MDRLTAAEFADAVDLDNNDGEPFELVPGKSVIVRGATKSEFITGIVRRFPAIERQFVQSAADELRAVRMKAQGVEVADKPSDTEYLEEQFRSGPELRNAFMAICCNHVGNPVVEAAVGRMRDARRDELLLLSCSKTWGNDFSGFLGLVVFELMGLESMAAMTGTMTVTPTVVHGTSLATSSSGSSAPAGA